MKKNRNVLFWLAVFLFLFSGCTGGPAKSSVPATEEERGTAAAGSPAGNDGMDLPEGYVLLARFEDAGRESEMRTNCLTDNTLYYHTRVYDRQLDRILIDVYAQEQGKETRQILHLGEEQKADQMDITTGEDGSLYFLYGEENAEGNVPVYTLEKRDKEQNKIYAVDTPGMEEIPPIISMKAGTDGTVYAITLEGIVLYWNAAGEYQGRITLPKTMETAASIGNPYTNTDICFGLANAGPSGMYAYWGGEEGEKEKENLIYLYDLNKWKKMDEEGQEPLRVDFSSATGAITDDFFSGLYVLSGYEEGLYLADKNRLWQIDLTDGSLKALFAWQDMSLKADYVKEVRRREDGGFLLYIFDTLEQENYWVTLEPVPASEVPEKTELVLGVAGGTFGNFLSVEGQSLASNINQVVLSFNRTHPNCHVTVREYERDQITDFQLELIGGTGPDILLDRDSLFDMDSLIAKGAVEDLSAYLERTEEGVSAEDIIPGILSLIQKEGKISCLPLSFAVDVVIVPENTPQEVMTPQELVVLMAQKDAVYTDWWIHPVSFLIGVLFGGEIDHYIDEVNASCSFDSDEFIRLLETCTVLYNHERIETRQDRAETFHAGQLTAIVQELNCMEDYLCIRAAFAGTGKICGFPNSQGELWYPVELYDRLGINSASEHKEEAWDFLSFCLSYTSRSDNVADRFVVMQDKFEQQTQYENTQAYPLDWNDYDDAWRGYLEIPPTTQEDMDFLRDIPNHLYLYENPDLQQVIEEELWAFFKGGIDAQEAAKRIQNRASLVLGE